jgi:hypothetical protein
VRRTNWLKIIVELCVNFKRPLILIAPFIGRSDNKSL